MSNSPSQVHPPKGKNLPFENTEVAFQGMTNSDLNRAYWLFKLISSNFLTKVGPPVINFALNIGLPVKPLIRATIFKHFCGGETIEECESTIQKLANGSVGSILDYSVEGAEEESVFDNTCREIIKTIQFAIGDKRTPITVFKMTGIGRFALLEKINSKRPLSDDEIKEYSRVKNRAGQICRSAFDAGIPVMIDAEETWIQGPIDDLALEMMRKYNAEKPIVYNTYQLYRKNILESLIAGTTIAQAENFILGAKLVRGAYMEKERERAENMRYPSPINDTKEITDTQYNDALIHCLDHVDSIGLVAGTHNEDSCRFLAELLDRKGILHNHPHVYFSQLLGMSDNLSFNLSNAGYNVAKYVPYGPVKDVLSYLFRRAEENTSISGQMGRELSLIIKEKKRRKMN